jgi:PBP1b-binding outer membrane lipoprotein LpoB
MSKYSLIVLVAVFISVSCSSSKEKEKAAIEQLIKNNAEFFQKEELDAYIGTLDPASPEIENTRAMMIELFENYDLKLTIESTRILKMSENKADVEVEQVTSKVSGPDFADNRTKIVHQLKKVDGAWKISGSKPIKIDYFNKE